MHTELPNPGAAAREHSQNLAALIRERITAAGGWIGFADYMQLALYAPGYGYYSAGATKFGAAGDFVTAPEISSLFSRCVARQCAHVLESMGGGDVLEPGAGTGTMAVDMLREFERLGQIPERYLILETSAELRRRQQENIKSLPEHLVARVHWLDVLPQTPIRGVIVANEVADALPVRRFIMTDNGVGELGVAVIEGRLVAEVTEADPQMADRVNQLFAGQGAPEAGYCSELNDLLPGWVASLAGCLNAGIILLFDYGFSRQEYYLPERRSGTLRCYFRHRAHEDPFVWPGLQDITAWVDFSLLAQSALDAELVVDGYTTQAQFLLAGGIDEMVEQLIDQEPKAQVEMAQGLRQLLLPGEMGEAIKVMALRRGDVAVPPAMFGRDMRSSL